MSANSVFLSSSSTTTTTHSPSNSLKEKAYILWLDNLKDQYCKAMGRPMPPYIANEVLTDIKSGTPAYFYFYAIRETALAPMPSWRYTAAIIRRLKIERPKPADLE